MNVLHGSSPPDRPSSDSWVYFVRVLRQFQKNDADTVWPLPAGDWTADADDCDAYSTTPAAADDGDATADDGALGAAAPGAADGDGAAAAACAGARSGLQHPASAAREVGQAPGGRADAY